MAVADAHRGSRRISQVRRARRPAALRHLRQRRRRQEHADRPPALRGRGSVRGPAAGARVRLTRLRHAGRRTSTSRCCSTVWPPSASRGSRSTSPTATSRRRSASSSSPTRRATSSTRATWSPAPRTRTAPCCCSTRARARSRRPAVTPTSSRCSASATWRWRSTSSIWSTIPRSASRSSRPNARISRTSSDWSTSPASRWPRLHGDNVIARSPNTPWYQGPTLLEYLETVELDEDRMQAEAVPASRPVGQPARRRLPRLRRHDRERQDQPRRRDPRAALAA